MTAEASSTQRSLPRTSADPTRPGGAPRDALTAGPFDATAAFGAPQLAAEAAPRLLVVSGPGAGRSHSLHSAETALGRDASCAVVLLDPAVSRRHAVIRREGPAHVLVDRGSGNGTKVNGRKVARHRLRPGDEIAIGKAVLLFAAGAGAPGEIDPVGRSGAGGARGRALAVIPLALLAAAAVGAVLLLARARGEAAREQAVREGERRALAQRHLAEAERLFGQGRGGEARQQLAIAGELGAGPQAAELGARADAEAPRQQALERARTALAQKDYRAALEGLESIPKGSLLEPSAAALRAEVDRALDSAVSEGRAALGEGDVERASAAARAVLAAAPSHAGAQALEQAARLPAEAPKEPAAPRPERAEALSRRPAARPIEAGSAAGAILAQYRSGDLAGALLRARAAADGRSRQLARDLADFADALRDGRTKAGEGRKLEAIAALEAAAALDRDIAEDAGADAAAKPSRDAVSERSAPGLEVRRTLARLHLALGEAAAAGADDELPMAATHLRAVAGGAPEDAQARAALVRVAARAREVYLRGYVAKDADPEAARRAFRIVAASLPAADETAQKARHWLDKLDGKGKENG